MIDDDKVLIYAGDGRCYWKQDRCGYTSALYAGVFSREEAIALTSHCGPEKKVEFHPVPEDHIPTLKAERDTAEAQLRDCRARCERMRTMEGLPLDECAARLLWAEQQRDAAQAEAAKLLSVLECANKTAKRRGDALLTAQAGEARAMEALWNLAKDLQRVAADVRNHGNARIAHARAADTVTAAFNNLDSQPALNWLAQRNRNAAAGELNALADGCEKVNPVLAYQLRARAAVILAGALPPDTVEAEAQAKFQAQMSISDFLTTNEDSGDMDSTARLALAAEQLLAELGVTEPGAGDANHEMPVAGLMDKLYEAWNNYMRAKHGQADAIFEPEGEES